MKKTKIIGCAALGFVLVVGDSWAKLSLGEGDPSSDREAVSYTVQLPQSRLKAKKISRMGESSQANGRATMGTVPPPVALYKIVSLTASPSQLPATNNISKIKPSKKRCKVLPGTGQGWWFAAKPGETVKLNDVLSEHQPQDEMVADTITGSDPDNLTVFMQNSIIDIPNVPQQLVSYTGCP